jgi:hypothetical protein
MYVYACVGDENVPPRSEGNENRRPVRKGPKTPHAVKAVPKVMGEAVSRGPLAILRDRYVSLSRECSD